MLFIREFVVRKHERGLLFRNGDFERFLAAGVYRFFDPGKRIEIERFDLSQPEFEHRLLDYLVRWHPEAVEDLFVRVETGAGEIAVVHRNGHPWTFVGPERRALFWKGVVHVRAELVDVEAEPAVPRRIVQALLADLQARRVSPFERAIYVREVPEGHVGLLYVEGKLVGELAPGVHAFWKIGRSVTTDVLDVRVRALEVGERRWATFARCAARGQVGHRQNA
ncbi:MAG TPA: hypothetical protein VKA43_02755 [Gammaproteobacteria bacterium]|nr:hypothetical protein [Gammaproteobacteria bacterium]